MTEPAKPMCILRFQPSILKGILLQLETVELVNFSQCSRKSAKALSLLNLTHLKLELNLSSSWIQIDDVVKIESRKFRATDLGKITGLQYFENSRTRVCRGENQKLITFWDDRFNGLKTIFMHYSNLFNCPTYSVKSDASVPAHIFLLILHRITSVQQEIKGLDIAARSLVENNVKWIMERLRVTEDLMLGEQLSREFGRNNLLTFDAKSIFIFNAGWVTAQNLEAMKESVSIELDGAVLTNQEIAKFFDDWRAVEYPNLEYFSVKSEKLSEDFTLPGFNQLEDNTWVFFKQIRKQNRQVRSYVILLRNDGVQGKVRFDKINREIKLMV